MRMRTTRRDEEVRRERLLAQAKDLQLRATRFKEKVRPAIFIYLIHIIFFDKWGSMHLEGWVKPRKNRRPVDSKTFDQVSFVGFLLLVRSRYRRRPLDLDLGILSSFRTKKLLQLEEEREKVMLYTTTLSD